MRLIKLETTITPERTLTLRVPDDVPTGSTEILVVFASAETAPQPSSTLGDLQTSEFFGIWQDREDLTDSPALARQLREQAWKR